MKIRAREIKKGNRLWVEGTYYKVKSVVVKEDVVYAFTSIGLFNFKPDDEVIIKGDEK